MLDIWLAVAYYELIRKFHARIYLPKRNTKFLTLRHDRVPKCIENFWARVSRLEIISDWHLKSLQFQKESGKFSFPRLHSISPPFDLKLSNVNHRSPPATPLLLRQTNLQSEPNIRFVLSHFLFLFMAGPALETKTIQFTIWKIVESFHRKWLLKREPRNSKHTTISII